MARRSCGLGNSNRQQVRHLEPKPPGAARPAPPPTLPPPRGRGAWPPPHKHGQGRASSSCCTSISVLQAEGGTCATTRLLSAAARWPGQGWSRAECPGLCVASRELSVCSQEGWPVLQVLPLPSIKPGEVSRQETLSQRTTVCGQEEGGSYRLLNKPVGALTCCEPSTHLGLLKAETELGPRAVPGDVTQENGRLDLGNHGDSAPTDRQLDQLRTPWEDR